jgi:hypothetical protein
MKPIFVSLAVFLLAFIALRHAMPGGIVLYQGTAVGFLVSVPLWFYLKSRCGGLQAFKDSLLTFVLIYSFVFTVPTTVDRSYSVKMLNRFATEGRGLTEKEISDEYVRYFVSGGGVERRIKEQTGTGSIQKDASGQWVLTPRGRFLVWTFRLTEVLFACRM